MKWNAGTWRISSLARRDQQPRAPNPLSRFVPKSQSKRLVRLHSLQCCKSWSLSSTKMKGRGWRRQLYYCSVPFWIKVLCSFILLPGELTRRDCRLTKNWPSRADGVMITPQWEQEKRLFQVSCSTCKFRKNLLLHHDDHEFNRHQRATRHPFHKVGCMFHANQQGAFPDYLHKWFAPQRHSQHRQRTLLRNQLCFSFCALPGTASSPPTDQAWASSYLRHLIPWGQALLQEIHARVTWAKGTSIRSCKRGGGGGRKKSVKGKRKKKREKKKKRKLLKNDKWKRKLYRATSAGVPSPLRESASKSAPAFTQALEPSSDPQYAIWCSVVYEFP